MNKVVFRQSVFETNSSSMHSISISKDSSKQNKIIKELHKKSKNGMYELNSKDTRIEFNKFDYELVTNFIEKLQYFIQDNSEISNVKKIKNKTMVANLINKNQEYDWSFPDGVSNNKALYLHLNKKAKNWLDKLFRDYAGLELDLTNFIYGYIDHQSKGITKDLKRFDTFVNFMLNDSVIYLDSDEEYYFEKHYPKSSGKYDWGGGVFEKQERRLK